MTPRRILVPLVGVDNERKTLTLAFRAAKAIGGHVDAVFILPDPNEALPYLGEGLTGGMIEEILQSAKQRGEACAQLARRLFGEAAQAAGASMIEKPESGSRLTGRFREEMGSVGEVVARVAAVSDLVVTGDAVVEPTIFEAALIDAGRPVLIAPQGDLPAAFGQNIVIAWRESTEAGHAVSAALPFLKGAKSVKVATLKRDAAAQGGAGTATGSVCDYLGFHGVAASGHVYEPGGKPVSQALLETIAREGADLLVMGGYGHSRLREFILGGVTREVVGAVAIPILMAH